MTPTPTDYANAADLAAMAAEIGFGPKDADKLRKGVVDDEEIAGFLERVAGIRRAALEEAVEVADDHAARAWEIAEREGQNIVCASGRNHGARAVATAIRKLMNREIGA